MIRTDIRATYDIFPAWSQNFWTWLTGKALAGQKPLFHHTPITSLVAALSTFFIGLLAGAIGTTSQSYWGLCLLFFGWCLTVNASRRLVSTIMHQCVHNRFSSDKKFNKLLAELTSSLVSVQNAEEYPHGHFS